MSESHNIRLAKAEDWPRLEKIWTYSFSDSEEFTRWYFSDYADKNEILVFEKDGQVVASLQLIKEILITKHARLNVRYIVGVNCLPEMRGFGITRQLMDEALGFFADENKVDLFILMPFEASFYYDYGFVFGSYHARMELPIEEFIGYKNQSGHFKRIEASSVQESNIIKSCQNLYTIWHQKDFDFYLYRDERQWNAFFKDLAFEKGQLVFWYNKTNQVEGYLAYFMAEDQLSVREMCYISDQARDAMYYFLASHRSQKKHVEWSAPLTEKIIHNRKQDKKSISLYPFMMFSIHNIKSIAMFAKRLPEKDLIFSIENITYVWYANSRKIEILENPTKNVITLTQEELNHIVFAKQFSPSYSRNQYGELSALFDQAYNYLNAYF